jgi:hypothetical protein
MPREMRLPERIPAPISPWMVAMARMRMPAMRLQDAGRVAERDRHDA